MRIKKKIPDSCSSWLAEIRAAYNDAYETIPYGAFTGTKITLDDLFHMAPAICLKFRGIKRTKRRMKIVTEAALSSYIATKDKEKSIFEEPLISFSFCYLASHYALNIIDDKIVYTLMEYIENNIDEIKEQTVRRR